MFDPFFSLIFFFIQLPITNAITHTIQNCACLMRTKKEKNNNTIIFTHHFFSLHRTKSLCNCTR